MNQNDKKQFSEIMIGLAENFGGAVSPEGMRARFSALAEYDICQVVAAADHLMKFREKAFPAMPMVSEFIRAIEAQASPQISAKNCAEIQVDIVLKKLRYQGSNAPIDFKDPITFRLMTTRWSYGSWAANVLEKDLTWWRKEFVEAYQAYGERDEAQAMLLHPPEENQAVDELKKIALSIVR